jgi:hypothetical protein
MNASTLLLEKEAPQATPGSAARLIREVKYKTRKRVSSEDKIRIVLGIKGMHYLITLRFLYFNISKPNHQWLEVRVPLMPP